MIKLIKKLLTKLIKSIKSGTEPNIAIHTAQKISRVYIEIEFQEDGVEMPTELPSNVVSIQPYLDRR